MPDEQWAFIPSQSGYAISTLGRVRSKHGNLTAAWWDQRLRVKIRNKSHVVTELVAEAHGPDIATALSLDINRTLTEYERTEIEDAEGYKSVKELADEFRVSPDAIRRVLDDL